MSISGSGISEVAIGESGGVNVLVPQLNVTVALYAPTIIPEVTLTSFVSVTVQSWPPQVIATVFGDTLIGNSISESGLGEGAIGEGGLIGAATIIADTPTAVTVTLYTPVIECGVHVDVPVQDVAVALQTPHIGISATVEGLTPIAVTAALLVPKLEHDINIPLTTVVVTPLAPVIECGVNVGVPLLNVAVAPQVPRPTAGKSEFIPGDIPVAVALWPPRIAVGIKVNAWNVVTDTELRGMISDHAISELGISGDGSETRTVIYSIPVAVVALPPQIQAGKRVEPPALPVAVAVLVPELSARPRRVRAQFIAS